MTAKPDGRKDGRATPSPRIPPSPEPTASDRSVEMIASDDLRQWSSSPSRDAWIARRRGARHDLASAPSTIGRPATRSPRTPRATPNSVTLGTMSTTVGRRARRPGRGYPSSSLAAVGQLAVGIRAAGLGCACDAVVGNRQRRLRHPTYQCSAPARARRTPCKPRRTLKTPATARSNAPTLAQSPTHDPQQADRAPGDSPKPRIYRPFTVSSPRPEGPSRRTATASAQMLARLAARKHGALEAAVLLGVNDAAHAEEHRQRTSGQRDCCNPAKRPRQIRSELAIPPSELAPGGRSRGTARACDLPRIGSRASPGLDAHPRVNARAPATDNRRSRRPRTCAFAGRCGTARALAFLSRPTPIVQRLAPGIAQKERRRTGVAAVSVAPHERRTTLPPGSGQRDRARHHYLTGQARHDDCGGCIECLIATQLPGVQLLAHGQLDLSAAR